MGVVANQMLQDALIKLSERTGEKKDKKNKFRICLWIIAGILIVGMLVFGFYLIFAKQIEVKMCYYRNEPSFAKIASSFKQFQEPSLKSVEYDLLTDTMLKRYEEEEKTEECEEEVKGLLKGLYEEYQPRNEKYVFTSITAFYNENGEMLLRIKVKSELINSEEYRNYYLVYIDENYKGDSSDSGADPMVRKPFAGNWCTFSCDVPRG